MKCVAKICFKCQIIFLKFQFLKCPICWNDFIIIIITSLQLFCFSVISPFLSPNLRWRIPPTHTHYFKDWLLCSTHADRKRDDRMCLKLFCSSHFHPSPCDLMESVNGWCLVGSADSQGDGDKRPELHVENKEKQTLLEKLWCVFSLVETLQSLWKCCK